MQLLVVALGIVAVASLPCLLALVCGANGGAARAVRIVGRRLTVPWLRGRRLWPGQSWRERRRLARLARTVRRPKRELPHEPAGPPIEQVAADLRRLGNQRLGVGRHSAVWFAAVERAYDDRLRVACRELGVEEHLAELDGIDLDIERVRVEGALQAEGVDLHLSDAGNRPDAR